MLIWIATVAAVSILAAPAGHEATHSLRTQSERPMTQSSAAQPEAISLFGQPLFPAQLSSDQRTKLEADLAEAKADYDKDPSDPERIVWLGRRLGYLGRYRDAIDAYTKGIAAHPRYAKLYRHRGHRYISIRRFDAAIADFENAAALVNGQPNEVEPDGAPNQYNKPRSTLQSNIWYHLGLAYYLKGDFQNALRSYLECMTVSRINDDMLVATADWLYMTYRRLGRTAEAAAVLEPIREDMDILENGSYHKRLLMYKGMLAPDALLKTEGASDLDIATQGYGVGNWYLYNGQKDKAREIFERVTTGASWSALGYIAAEGDLKRGF